MGKETWRDTHETAAGIEPSPAGEREAPILVDDLKTQDARQVWILDKKHKLPDAKKAWEKFWMTCYREEQGTVPQDDYDRYVDYLRKEKAP